MNIFNSLFVTKDEALEAGFTHEAKLYGLGVWIQEPYSENILVACKFQPSMIVHIVCDWFIDFMMLFANSDVSYELPLKNLRLIK